MNRNIVQALTLTNIASASVTSSYQAINSSGFTHPCFKVCINNASNKDVTVSYDGSTDNEYVIAGTTFEFNSPNNTSPNSQQAEFAQGTIVYVKGTAGTGNVYLSGYYQPTIG